jgi:hypothetical protein
MFEQASRLKLRFSTPVGLISVEDLWDLPLTSKVGRAHTIIGHNLDDLARDLSKRVAETEESFVEKPASKDIETNLRFEIVKRVIEVRLEERDKAKAALAKKAKKQKILEILASKEDNAMQDMSEEDLKKMLEEL